MTATLRITIALALVCSPPVTHASNSLPAQKNFWDASGAALCAKVGDRVYDAATDKCLPPSNETACIRLGGTWAENKCGLGGGSGGLTMEQVCKMIGGRFVPASGTEEAKCMAAELDAGVTFSDNAEWFQHNVRTRFYKTVAGVYGFFFWDPEWGSSAMTRAKRLELTNFDPENENSYRGSLMYAGSDGKVLLNFCIAPQRGGIPRLYVQYGRHERGHGWNLDYAGKWFSACVDHGHANRGGRVGAFARHEFGKPKDCADFTLFDSQHMPLSCDRVNCP